MFFHLKEVINIVLIWVQSYLVRGKNTRSIKTKSCVYPVWQGANPNYLSVEIFIKPYTIIDYVYVLLDIAYNLSLNSLA